jgi:hypothetical protein
VPNVNLARLFIRQSIGLGGAQETIEDDALHLGSRQDVSRVTLTLGKMNVKDIFDNNLYANDPRTQFLSNTRTPRWIISSLITQPIIAIVARFPFWPHGCTWSSDRRFRPVSGTGRGHRPD